MLGMLKINGKILLSNCICSSVCIVHNMEDIFLQESFLNENCDPEAVLLSIGFNTGFEI